LAKSHPVMLFEGSEGIEILPTIKKNQFEVC
jgi:hypothetical protein